MLIDGQSAWIVESGAVVLFSVECTGDSTDGPRQFLFRLDAGEAVLAGFAPEFPHYRVLAVAINKAELQPVAKDHLIDAAAASDSSSRQYIQKWLEKIGAPSAIEGQPSATKLTGLLSDAETHWLQDFETRKAHGKEEERARLVRKQKLIESTTVETLNGLAAVLEPVTRPIPPSDGPILLRAMQAVGRAEGIELRAPAFSENRMDPILAIVNASGIRARRVVLGGEWWKSESGALLGFLAGSTEPVALIPKRGSRIGGSCYELFNPADNSRIELDASAAAKLSGVGYTLYRSLRDQIGSVSTFRFVLQGRGKDLLIIMLAGVGATVLGMLTPQAMSILVEQAIPDGNHSMILQLGIGLLTAAAGAMLFELVQAAGILRIEIGSSSVLQCGVWDRLLKLSPTFFRKYSAGDLASRAGAINTIRQQLSGATLRTIFIGVTSLLNLGLMFYYSPTLALISILLAVIVIAITSSSGVLLMRFVRPLQELEGELYGLVVQLVNGAGKLQIAAAEERAFAHWGKLYSRQQQLKQVVQKLQDRVRLVNVVLPVLSAALIFWFVEEWLRNPVSNAGGMTLGTFLAFNAAFGVFFAGATSLSDTAIGLLNVKDLWRRARVILDAPPEVDQTKVHPGKLTGRLKIDHVTFRYRQDGPLILDDVSIEAGPGECIALVGPSGSGKSTILQLLLRFEVPASGAIYYDGQNLDGLDVSAVRRQLGVVLQENKISAGSIFENIVCGSLCTLDDAWQAARAAGFDADIEAMPMKMHTPISEGGGNISGGQRQRLLIARALVIKPSILIFDEATSALDNRTQEIVTSSLRRLKVTTILVAHRLSTIRYADRIYVIEAGRVVQRGQFEDLARQEGLFARLIARQMI